jgi:hypothetical protein
MNPGGGAVERDLPTGDPHTTRSLVTQTQDPLVVGDDDQADVGLRRVTKDLGDVIDMIGCDPYSTRATKDVAISLAGKPHGWRINDRHELAKVFDQNPIVESLVSILKG